MVKENEIEELAELLRNSRVRTGSTKSLIEDFLKTGKPYQILPKLLTNGQISGINNRYSQKVVAKNIKDKTGKKVSILIRPEVWEQVKEKLNK